eukprot:scaffold661174_cov53-Prasinocladus_malaysianus.AAC.1
MAEVRGVTARLATLRQADGAARTHATEALKKLERLRGDVLETTEAAEYACSRAAEVSSENARLQSRAAQTEKAIQ